MSVFAYLIKGENDDYLPWPFTGTVTFEHLEDKNHHSRSDMFPSNDEVSQQVVDKERSSFGWGRPTYISHLNLAITQPRIVNISRMIASISRSVLIEIALLPPG